MKMKIMLDAVYRWRIIFVDKFKSTEKQWRENGTKEEKLFDDDQRRDLAAGEKKKTEKEKKNASKQKHVLTDSLLASTVRARATRPIDRICLSVC